MSDSYDLDRRQVLSATGAAIVGGLWATGSAAADNRRTNTADLTGEAVGVDTNATGTATVTVDDGETHYELWVSCLRGGTHVTVSADGEVVTEYDLEGPVTDGIVRDETILEGTTDVDALLDAFEDSEVTITVHTDQHPDGEIGGTFSADKVSEDPIEEPDEEEDEEPEEDPEEDPEPVTTAEGTTFELGEINVGEGVSADDEFVTLQNDGDNTIDFTGWTMQDRRDEGVVDTPGGASAYPFLDGFTLEADAEVRIFTGGDECDDTDEELH